MAVPAEEDPMTEPEVRNEIYNAITMGRDDNGKAILRHVEIASELRRKGSLS
jgi:hypothetical protein